MNISSKRIAMGNAHSKLILAGEHAVVYGKPAIAILFPLKAKAIVEKSNGAIQFESSIYSGVLDNMPEKMKGISECIKKTLYQLNEPYTGLKITINSSIPLGRGLGSSAAVATAIVRSLFSFFGQEPTEADLETIVHIAETHAHGTPSGIDTAAVASDVPIWFEKGKSVKQIKVNIPLFIVVADTGRIGDTRTAVEKVKKKYNLETEQTQKSLNEIEKIVKGVRSALTSGDIRLLGELMNRNHEELVALGVSDQTLNELIKTSIQTGALGAKLTGGGLGGCMMALAETLEQASRISKELVKEGAARSWYFSTEGDILYETS